MGFVVLHIEKPKGNDAGTSAHIERKVHPTNADQSREHLNQKLVEYPDGVENRTQAIQRRIETAGVTRKIGTNQVRALRIMLSGTPEDMQRIEAAGRLDEWCADNMKWLWDTFGKDNVVSADLHRDEKTPHIHATVVPIVTGERRKAAKPTEPGKKKYRKKPANALRLCADDVMTRDNLERFQDSYAEVMGKYGLQRGIRGSDARHIATPQYYRDLYEKNEDLKEDIENLQETKEIRQQEIEELDQKGHDARTRAKQATAEKQQAETELAGKQSELQKVKGELKAEKFKSSAAEAGSALMDGISSALGTSKVKRQQQEIDTLKTENLSQQLEITKLNQTINRERQGNEKTTNELETELNKFYEWFPDAKSLVKWGEYCKKIGFSDGQAKDLVNMKPVLFSGELYSNEHYQRFKADNAEIRLEKDKRGIFGLMIDKIDIIQWFRQKYKEFQKAIGINIPERKQGNGMVIK